MTRLRVRWVVLVMGLVLMATPAATAADVEGLPGPLFGLEGTKSGRLLVADASTGIHVIKGGEVKAVIELPGATDVSRKHRGRLWATTGGLDPQADSGQAIWKVSKNGKRLVANLFEFEATVNPDGKDPFDSNPFDVQALSRHKALVVDAGGNDLLKVKRNGDIKVLAVFPDQLVSTDNIKKLAGCPDPPIPPFQDFCDLPEMIPAESVPTSVAVGPDGHFYVGELIGFPAPTDASGIWRVAPDADWEMCPSDKCVKVFEGGFTSIIDMEFTPHGKLLVAEMDEASWAAVEIFGDGVGGTINKCDVEAKKCEEVATEIPQLTAIALKGHKHNPTLTDHRHRVKLFATKNSLIPNMGEVIRIR